MTKLPDTLPRRPLPYRIRTTQGTSTYWLPSRVMGQVLRGDFVPASRSRRAERLSGAARSDSGGYRIKGNVRCSGASNLRRCPAARKVGREAGQCEGQGSIRQTQVDIGGTERLGQGGAGIQTVQSARDGEGPRRVASGVPGAEHQADEGAGGVLSEPRTRRAFGKRMRRDTAHTNRQPLSLRGGVRRCDALDSARLIHVKRPATQPPRTNNPAPRLLRRTLLGGTDERQSTFATSGAVSYFGYSKRPNYAPMSPAANRSDRIKLEESNVPLGTRREK